MKIRFKTWSCQSIHEYIHTIQTIHMFAYCAGFIYAYMLESYAHFLSLS